MKTLLFVSAALVFNAIISFWQMAHVVVALLTGETGVINFISCFVFFTTTIASLWLAHKDYMYWKKFRIDQVTEALTQGERHAPLP